MKNRDKFIITIDMEKMPYDTQRKREVILISIDDLFCDVECGIFFVEFHFRLQEMGLNGFSDFVRFNAVCTDVRPGLFTFPYHTDFLKVCFESTPCFPVGLTDIITGGSTFLTYNAFFTHVANNSRFKKLMQIWT